MSPVLKKSDNNVELIAYKYYGIPSIIDLQLELKTFGCCRKVWNLMLSDKNNYYKEYKKNLDVSPSKYKKDYPYLKEVDSLALANVQLNLESAFSRFFKKKSKYPVFKSRKKSHKSYTTNALYVKKNNGTTFCNIELNDLGNGLGTLKLPKHKDLIKLIMHRPVKSGGTLKSVTISMDADGKFYYSILMEYPKTECSKKIDADNCIGLDMSLPKLYVDSNGNSPEYPKPYRTVESRISKIQKRMARKKRGSKNYEKEHQKLAKTYVKSKHQRSDFLHKLSCELTDTYDIIGIEDLDMSAMKRSLHFGKSVSDNGWGMFTTMLQYKADKKGKKLIKVNKWFPSSKKCLKCGYIHKELKLSDRTYICPKCGNVMDRDHQASINIKNEAKQYYLDSIA